VNPKEPPQGRTLAVVSPKGVYYPLRPESALLEQWHDLRLRGQGFHVYVIASEQLIPSASILPAGGPAQSLALGAERVAGRRPLSTS
jgi:hypothetical protein